MLPRNLHFRLGPQDLASLVACYTGKALKMLSCCLQVGRQLFLSISMSLTLPSWESKWQTLGVLYLACMACMACTWHAVSQSFWKMLCLILFPYFFMLHLIQFQLCQANDWRRWWLESVVRRKTPERRSRIVKFIQTQADHQVEVLCNKSPTWLLVSVRTMHCVLIVPSGKKRAVFQTTWRPIARSPPTFWQSSSLSWLILSLPQSAHLILVKTQTNICFCRLRWFCFVDPKKINLIEIHSSSEPCLNESCDSYERKANISISCKYIQS